MITIGDKPLTIDEVVEVSLEKELCELGKNSIECINLSTERLNKILLNGNPVYGINTGFGIFANKSIKNDQLVKLNRNLILSHAVGTGEPLIDEIVRAAMLIRVNTLAKGFSGIRLEVINTIVEALNKKVTPVIPSQGSLGSSGDLCPLSHLALVFTTDEKDLENDSGFAVFNGELLSGKKAMHEANIKRSILGPKEGLALNNGATFSVAMMALAVYEAKYLLGVANKAISLTLEALQGCPDAFDDRIHSARGLIGQIDVAKEISNLIEGSTLVGSTNRVQDAYSLRCAPQIHGSVLDTINFVKSIVEKEINAATDNPLIFGPAEAKSGGNFHGEPIAMVADFLGIALAELGAISERRIYRMTDEKMNNGLPSMLVGSSEFEGLNSGIMILQYTAASLVLENQTLASPDSIHSLPTSGGQEDHNANAMTAAKHALQIVNNIRHILSIELYAAARAIDLRKRVLNGNLGKGNLITYNTVRSKVPFIDDDCLWGNEVDRLKELLVKHVL